MTEVNTERSISMDEVARNMCLGMGVDPSARGRVRKGDDLVRRPRRQPQPQPSSSERTAESVEVAKAKGLRFTDPDPTPASKKSTEKKARAEKPKRKVTRTRQTGESAAAEYVGVLVRWKPEKGFGFVAVDGGITELGGKTDIFVHVSQFSEADIDPDTLGGAKLAFSVGEHGGRPVAVSLKKV